MVVDGVQEADFRLLACPAPKVRVGRAGNADQSPARVNEWQRSRRVFEQDASVLPSTTTSHSSGH